MPLLNIALVPAPDRVVVRLTGDADLSTVPLLTDALAQAARLATPQVVVDVVSAHFWDCSGLRALAVFTAELKTAGRACRLVGALPATRRLIGAADLGDRLDLDGPLSRQPTAVPGRTGVPARHPVNGHPAPSRSAQPVAAGRRG